MTTEYTVWRKSNSTVWEMVLSPVQRETDAVRVMQITAQQYPDDTVIVRRSEVIDSISPDDRAADIAALKAHPLYTMTLGNYTIRNE
jgi:hypothetical protein